MKESKMEPSSTLVKKYQRTFTEHGDTPAGVMWPRGRQSLRFDALTRHFSNDQFSVLDYGCGLGHLKDYLDERFNHYEYHGADLVPEFVQTVMTKHPEAKVQLVQSHEDVSTPVDHVVISGTFNIIDGSDQVAYVKLIQAALIHLFELTRVSLAVNFMTDRVDFTQPQNLHMNVEEMMNFMRRQLSPRIRVDEAYMPYEFTIIAFKDSTIVKPNNIYRPA